LDFKFFNLSGVCLDLDWVLNIQDWIWIANFDSPLVSGSYVFEKVVWNFVQEKRFSSFWAKYSGRFCFVLKLFLHSNELFPGYNTFCQWCARVIFVKSESSQSHKPFESESSQNHLKIFRVVSESSHDLVESERVTKTVRSLRVIGLQARVNVQSHKIKNDTQCCFNKFDCRLFISKFSQFAIYLSLSLSVISASLTQACCRYCNLSLSVVLNVRFTTNAMCVKNNLHIYVVWTSSNRVSMTWDIYCCLLP